MSIEITRGISQKPVSSGQLVSLLSHQPDLSGRLTIGYPIIGTAEGSHSVDALWVSYQKGIVLFDLIEGGDESKIAGYESRQDDSFNKLEGSLKSHPELMRRRDLRIPIHTVSFAPGVSDIRHGGEYPITNGEDLIEVLNRFDWTDRDGTIYEAAVSVLQDVSAIRKNTPRRFVRSDSRSAKLEKLENSIATLDYWQNKAVIETVEGAQRIRGLAGSGKTIVLALKAAYLHAQNPDWRIAVTHYTRSLNEQFHRLINRFCISKTGAEPNWENLRIVNSWGGTGGPESDGLYYEFCRIHGVKYLNYGEASGRFGNDRAFSGACSYALEQAQEYQPAYNAILIDEAQDFSPSFLNLCFKLLEEPQRLIYAYDELQSLSEASLPSPEDIFGTQGDGSPVVQLSKTDYSGGQGDIVLEKCYRHSRPVLITAHALGFGIYREPHKGSETGLIQMFGNPQLWTDVGYRIKQGSLREGQPVILERSEETSPRFLEDHSSIDDLLQFKLFDDELKQAEWLADAIAKNLREDELRYDDIVVINPDPRATRSKIALSRRLLSEQGVSSHLAGVETDRNTFFQPDSITFTGIYRAKGNEAGMIYIINAQDCDSTAANLATIRNRLFTAITRSKAWVRVLGVGSGMEHLIEEYEMLKNRNFELDFKYPTAQEREHLRVVHRELTSQEIQQREGHQMHLESLLEDIRAGNFYMEDLDRSSVEELKKLLGGSDADP